MSGRIIFRLALLGGLSGVMGSLSCGNISAPNPPSVSTPQIQPLLSDGFESGDLAKWNFATGRATTDTDVVYAGKYSLQVHYPQGTDDANQFLIYQFSPQLDHVFVRGYVYFPTPVSGQCGQRKLYYFKTSDVNNISNGAEYAASAILTSDQTATIGNGHQLELRVATGDFINGENRDPHSTTLLNQNTWYCLEFEVQLNTPGQFDGYYNVWINGVQEKSLNGRNVRIRDASITDIWNKVEIGRQLDPYTCDTLIPVNASEEYRYWDNIAISMQGPIGP